jgi:hypothetical protein
MSAVPDFRSTEFDDAARAATRKAFEETLAAGLPGTDRRWSGASAPVYDNAVFVPN